MILREALLRAHAPRSTPNPLYSIRQTRLQKIIDTSERLSTLLSVLEGSVMPEKKTMERAQQDAREGKSPSTQAGEFVREEMHHMREGKHGAASPQQAIAIGLSKARRAGVKLPTPRSGKASAETIKQARRDERKGQSHSASEPSATRSRATTRALKREGRSAASHDSLSRHAQRVAKKRGRSARHNSAVKASRTRSRTSRSRTKKTR
jgi:Family of unknown function (DUF6496)